MALDTAHKRGSVFGLSIPGRPWLATPDGALASTDRIALLYFAGAIAPGEFVEPPAPPPRATGAGRPSRERRRRYEVELDGEVFDVASPAEAEAILNRARELAAEKADTVIARATAATKRAPRKVMQDARRALQPPAISAPPDLSPIVQSVLEQIGAIYASALRSVEIEVLLRQRQAELDEDDEAVLLLM